MSNSKKDRPVSVDKAAWEALHSHLFFSGEPGPPGTEHLWGDRDYEDYYDEHCANLEALIQVQVEHRAVLLIAYDAAYPEPLFSERPIPDAFGVALVLAPAAGSTSLARQPPPSHAPKSTVPLPVHIER